VHFFFCKCISKPTVCRSLLHQIKSCIPSYCRAIYVGLGVVLVANLVYVSEKWLKKPVTFFCFLWPLSEVGVAFCEAETPSQNV